MISQLKISILVDNVSDNPGFKGEHGLSLFIEADNHRILFDTGQSDILFDNACQLGIDLSTADTIVLSHGHYDHTGGVAKVLEINRTASVYCHSEVLVPRYSQQDDGRMKLIGIDAGSSEALYSAFDRLRFVNTPVYLSENIGITGPVPRMNDFEDTGGKFFLDFGATRPDPVNDDLALWIKTEQGLFIICGCCHSGIVNTIEYITKLANRQVVNSIIGGFHLLHAKSRRMERTIEFLNSLHINQIISCHCTGEKQVEKLRGIPGTRLSSGAAGKQFKFL